jgi:hypothetical protein
VFTFLNLECPFKLENGIILKKNSFLGSLSVKKRKRGRPKGSKKKPNANPVVSLPAPLAEKRGRGRPKGSKNKPKVGFTKV